VGRHGRRHPLGGLLAIAAAAVLAGARSFAAIGQFSKGVPQATLARLGTWRRPYSDWHVAPSETTLRWVLQQLDADELDRVLNLMQKYADVPMSLADACLVRMTETLADPVILTTDADFRIYRRHSRHVVPCITPY